MVIIYPLPIVLRAAARGRRGPVKAPLGRGGAVWSLDGGILPPDVSQTLTQQADLRESRRPRPPRTQTPPKT